jgi:hypothetical protein
MGASRRKEVREFKEQIAEYGLTMCDEFCDCGQESYLVFVDSNKSIDPRLPNWINGADMEAVKRWLDEQSKPTDQP